MDTQLSISEQFLVLAQHPDKGRFVVGQMFIQYGLVGALLLEMSLEDRIDISGDKLLLKNDRDISNSLHVDIASLIKASKKDRKVKQWVPRLARRAKKYRLEILKSLVQKRLIRIEDKKFLFIPYQKAYLRDAKTRNELIRDLKSKIMHPQQLEDGDAILLGLIEATQLSRIMSTDRKELKVIRAKLKQKVKESLIADSVSKTIKEVQAAIMISIMASTTTASTVASS